MKLKELEWKIKNIHNGWSVLSISTAVGNFVIDSALNNRHDKRVLSKIVDDRYVTVDSSSDLDALKYYVESLHTNYMYILFDKFVEKLFDNLIQSHYTCLTNLHHGATS